MARFDELAAAKAAGVALIVAPAFILERLGVGDLELEELLDALVIAAL